MSKLYKCSVCNKRKQLNDFYLRANGSVGEYKCKCCIKVKRSEKYNFDYNNVRIINRKAVSEYQKRNPDKNSYKVAKYVANKKKAFPSWLSQDDVSKIKSIYKMCRSISKKTGTLHQVDHIVPINGEICSGLHVPWNLRIITKDENLRKGNKLIEDIVCSHEKL